MDSTTIDQIRAGRTRLGAADRKALVRHLSRPARYVLHICDLAHLVEC
jgi:hypothetical protein